jgi:hypothetical protein
VGDLTEKLEELKGTYDVVTCFTLPGVIGAPDGRQVVGRIIKSLDRVTGRVLFVDSDESTDLRARVDGPDESLTALILRNTSFTRTYDLGVNHDPIARRSSSRPSRLIALVR